MKGKKKETSKGREKMGKKSSEKEPLKTDLPNKKAKKKEKCNSEKD